MAWYNYMNHTNGRTAFFRCLFFGWLGAHRFYCRRYVTGFLYLISGGFFGIGVIIDLFQIAYGKFKYRCPYTYGFLFDFDNMRNLCDSDEVPVGYKVICWLLPVIVVILFLS